MRRTRIPAVLLAAVISSACVADSPTASADADGLLSRRAITVPFSATYTAPPGFTPVPPATCPTELADITEGSGSGSSTAGFAGGFTGETFSCVDLATLQVTDGRFSFRAFTGDLVTGTYTLSGEVVEPGLIALTGPFQITGGTGRMAGATGSGTISGTANLVAELLTLTFTGGVSRPN